MHRLQRCIRSSLRQSCPNRAFSAAASAAASASSSSSFAQPALPAIQVLRLDHLRLPIRSQLRIEEALLRCKHPSVAGRSFFLLNQPPASESSVVLGLSNKTELLVHMDAAERDGIQLVRRFSGGGTVFIDQQCWMATMIIHKAAESTADSALPPLPVLTPPLVHPSSLPAYPNTLMDWTRDFYSPVFGPDPAEAQAWSDVAVSSSAVPSFSLTGHDYCFAQRKFGGNAQTITKDRWLHHTSFLWGLESLPRISAYLQIPAKAPAYRAGRSHGDFLTSLREVWTEVETRREASSNANRSSREHDMRRFTRGNEPSTSLYSDLFRSAAAETVSSASLSSSSSAVIPAALGARVLWRLSHYFRLEYPTLDEIEAIVAQYAEEAKSSVKMLDYTEERSRAKQAAIEAEEKRKAAEEAATIAAAAATTTERAASS